MKKTLTSLLLILLIPALLLAPVVTYADTYPYQVNRVYNGGGDYLYTEYKLINNSSGTKFLTKAAPISAKSIANLAKVAVKTATPAGAAITALLTLASLKAVYDPTDIGYGSQQLPSFRAYDFDTTGSYWYTSNWPPIPETNAYSSPYALAQAMADTMPERAQAAAPGAFGCMVDEYPVAYRPISTNGALTGAWSVNFTIRYKPGTPPTCLTGTTVQIGDYQISMTRTTSLAGRDLQGSQQTEGATDRQIANLITGVSSNGTSSYGPGTDLDLLEMLLQESVNHGYWQDNWSELTDFLEGLPDSAFDAATPTEGSSTNVTGGDITVNIPPIEIDLPDDYNREATQQQILESLTPDLTETQTQVQDAETDFLSELPTDVGALGVDAFTGSGDTTVNPLGDGITDAFENAGDCTNPTYTLAGHTMDVDVCGFWEPIRPIMAFVAWFMVAIYAFRRVSDVRAA